MGYSLIPFSQLTKNEIEQLAVLHHSVMHTLLSDLGLPIVLRYYQVAQADSKAIGLCVRAHSGEILGWAVGSPHPDRINAKLRAPLTWFMPQMVRLLVTRPAVLWQLFLSVFSASDQVKMKNGAMELTYIGVASSQRGRGLGKDLLDAFIETSRANGYDSIVLSVEQENVSAVSLYERAGFRIIKTFSEGRYQRHRMELSLA